VFDKDNKAVVDGERQVIDFIFLKNAWQCIDVDGNIRRNGDTLYGWIEFPQDIRVTKEKGKQAIFVFSVYVHKLLLNRYVFWPDNLS